MKLRHIFIFLFLFYDISFFFSQTAILTQQQKSWLEKANRHEKSGWIYIHIEGTPEERGFQHGYLTANEIKESLNKLSTKWKYISAMEWPWLVQKDGDILTKK